MSNETTLPTWDEMSDLDKGAALMHAWKRYREGTSYAVAHYPVRYFDHPALLALDDKAACDHAAKVSKGWQAWEDNEFDRLYDLALYADRKPGESR
jgi:hypothetical protein